MHEKERHRIILSAVVDRPVVTVVQVCNLTGASEATVRRDIATLYVQQKLRRVRGGAEAITPPQFVGLAGGLLLSTKQYIQKRRRPLHALLLSCVMMVIQLSSMGVQPPSKWFILWHRAVSQYSLTHFQLLNIYLSIPKIQ